MKVQSQNDKAKLEEAKHRTYLKGFTDGVMLRGVYEGEPVKIVKPKIRDLMLESGDAIVYSEPEKQVRSRAGDECVVALTDPERARACTPGPPVAPTDQLTRKISASIAGSGLSGAMMADAATMLTMACTPTTARNSRIASKLIAMPGVNPTTFNAGWVTATKAEIPVAMIPVLKKSINSPYISGNRR